MSIFLLHGWCLLGELQRFLLEKPLDEFRTDKNEPDGKGYSCKECNRKKATEYANRPEVRERRLAAMRIYHRQPKDRERRRKYSLKYHYGITIADYDDMWISQGGLCCICHKPQKQNFHVDHHHETGKIRGLLCGNCNTMLGLANDDILRLESAIRYLQKHSI